MSNKILALVGMPTVFEQARAWSNYGFNIGMEFESFKWSTAKKDG